MDKRGPAFRLVGVGFFIGACIVGGIFGGLWLDRIFHSQPVLAIVGLVFGLILAFWGVYQMLLPLLNNKNRPRR